MHHVIDPRTGLPAQTDIVTATVVAGTAVQAEAYAKAVMILGSHTGMKWLEEQEGVAGLLVHQSGEILYSAAVESYL
jgi:thiamine biosynthesis lipoprotein